MHLSPAKAEIAVIDDEAKPIEMKKVIMTQQALFEDDEADFSVPNL